MIHGLEEYLTDLLHINEVKSNKLIDLYAGDLKKTVFLSSAIPGVDNLTLTLEIIKKHLGEVGNTLIRNSAKSGNSEQRIGNNNTNSYDWEFADGTKDAKKFNDFIETIYKELSSKGFNPLFLSIGALKWKLLLKDKEVKIVKSPLIILPIKIIRSGQTSPLVIEFINDEIYFNPCLYAKLKQEVMTSVTENLPHPNNTKNFDEAITKEKLETIDDYLYRLKEYISSCKTNDDESVFEVEPEVIGVSTYNHNEICMYYDIRRNKDKIMNHPLIDKMFNKNDGQILENNNTASLELVLPHDSTQEEIIKKVVNGDSIIIKGPPGTGKTLTIANMISALLYENKRILFASKKISALTEVYAKLPIELQKFALLLDYETEAQAAKTNPTEIKKNFNSLLNDKKAYKFNQTVSIDRNTNRNVKNLAINNLNNYYNFMFNDKLLDSSYYEAINTYFKNEELPIIDIVKKQDVLAFNKEIYNNLISVINELETYYDTITANGKHKFNESPWYGLNELIESEDIYKKVSDAANKLKTACDEINKYENSDNLNPISIKMLMWLAKYKLDEISIDKICKLNIDSQNEEALTNVVNDYIKLNDIKYNKNLDLELSRLIEIYQDLGEFEEYKNVDDIIIKQIYDNYSLLTNELNLDAIQDILKVLDVINELTSEKNEALNKAYKIFRKDLTEKQIKQIIKAKIKFIPYIENPSKELGLFAVGVKNTYKKLSELSYLDDAQFREVVTATDMYNRSLDYDVKIKGKLSELYRLVQKQLSHEEISCLFNVLNASRSNNLEIKKFINNIYNNYANICEYANIAKLNKYTIDSLINEYKFAISYKKIINIINKYNESLNLEITDYLSFAMTFIAINNIKKLTNDNIYNIQLIINSKVNNNLYDGLFGLFNLSSLFTNNLYIEELEMMSYSKLKLYIEEIIDRNIFGAYVSYKNMLKEYTTNVCNLTLLFNDYETGKIDPYSYGLKNKFANIFEHSFYHILISAKLDSLKTNRNSFVSDAKASLTRFADSSNKISENNIKIIENILMSSINPNDPTYQFLGVKKDSRTLRSLFKENVDAILKLKKCFILSPSTASLLFRPEEYASFDIVIIDEASQLEPVNMVPVLFRAKQCVIVGDEWQMPPIEHFKTKNTSLIDNYDENLKRADSALSLALESNAFKYYELLCHYRSETESLIKFSQKEFYPNMRTFPAPTPKKEGLGINDIYIPNAISDGGVNKEEAKEVIEQIKLHMDKYYNEETKELSKSFGVIAFGLSQLDYIQKLLKEEKELNAKILEALGKYNDVKEKLIFFKTIETVQGQETDHVILSLTYGIDKKGNPVQRFGELNRDDLGKCIFNVSVTRAKEQITVIHSLQPEQIQNERIKYIADYLYITRYFSKNGHDQFVSVNPEDGFIKNIGKYLESLGISKDRIVYDYGVTDGSIRIPIAILAEDLMTAKCAIWAEKEYPGSKFIDINCKYYNVLERNGWKFHNVYAHSWYDNNQAEKRLLKEFISQYI